jgi:hypothetical protein
MVLSSRVGALGKGRRHRPSGPSSKRTPGVGADAYRVPVKPTANHACDMPLRLLALINPARVLEPVRRQCRVDGRAGDRPVTQPALNGPGVMSLVGERVAASVAQHVRVGLDLKAGAGRRALDHSAKPAVVNGDSRSLTKTKGDDGLSRLESVQRP